MSANRWAASLLLAAGLPCLPACFLTTKPAGAASAQATQPAPPPDGFASLPRQPGERIALSKPVPDEPPAEPVARADPGEITPPAQLTFTAPPAGGAPAAQAPDPAVVAALRAYVEGRPDLADEYLKAFDATNQNLLRQLLPAVARTAQINFAQPSVIDMGALASLLEGPAAAVAARAPLLIDKALFCRAVKGYGRYDPLQDQVNLKAGTLMPVYVEVRNTPWHRTSGPDGEGYATKLACTLQVRDAAGGVIEMMDAATDKMMPVIHLTKRDALRSPPRDYFLAPHFPVPLKPGAYTVTFEVRDPETGRATSKIMPFRVQ